MANNKLRFAPSPTGNLHIGNARTLILNYVYSKSISGDLILRIDDTDQDRSEEKYYHSIIKDIEWLKIIEQGYKVNTIFSEELERGVDTIEDYNYLNNKYENNIKT